MNKMTPKICSPSYILARIVNLTPCSFSEHCLGHTSLHDTSSLLE